MIAWALLMGALLNHSSSFNASEWSSIHCNVMRSFFFSSDRKCVQCIFRHGYECFVHIKCLIWPAFYCHSCFYTGNLSICIYLVLGSKHKQWSPAKVWSSVPRVAGRGSVRRNKEQVSHHRNSWPSHQTFYCSIPKGRVCLWLPFCEGGKSFNFSFKNICHSAIITNLCFYLTPQPPINLRMLWLSVI